MTVLHHRVAGWPYDERMTDQIRYNARQFLFRPKAQEALLEYIASACVMDVHAWLDKYFPTNSEPAWKVGPHSSWLPMPKPSFLENLKLEEVKDEEPFTPE